jgi:hypothetical protein
MEVPKREEKEHRNDHLSGGTGDRGILPGPDADETDNVHPDSGGSNGRIRSDRRIGQDEKWEKGGGQRSKTNAPYKPNKSESEIDSLIKVRLIMRIDIHKIINFFKKLMK